MKKSFILLTGILAINAIIHFYDLFYLPPEKTLGHLYKIIYVHVPLAWISYLAFTISLVSSISYIFKRKAVYDRISYASVILGVVSIGLSILLGSIFSKKAWGVYWEWREPRITSTFILFMVYLGYIALRQSITDIERSRKISAVYSIMAFVTIPISYISVRIFGSLHPLPLLSSEMRLALYLTFIANLLLYLWCLKNLYSYLSCKEKLLEVGE